MSQVGTKIRQLREGKGWTQTRLSVESGLAVSGISQIETGRRNPGARTLKKLAAALGVEVADLFPKTKERPSPFLNAWVEHMRRRADEWERDLDHPEETTMRRYTDLFYRCQLAEAEATTLFEIIATAIEDYGLTELADEERIALEKACLKVLSSMDRFYEIVSAAWIVNADSTARFIRARIHEQAGRAHQKRRQNGVSLLKEQQSAQAIPEISIDAQADQENEIHDQP